MRLSRNIRGVKMKQIRMNITFKEALDVFNGDMRLMARTLGPVSRQALYKWKADNKLPSTRILKLQHYIYENERDDMQFYYHHIGDFIKSTHYLSHEDRSVYLGLLWLYYDTEKPLTKNISELAMKVQSKNEVVERLLSVFFIETKKGYVNKRAEAELAKVYDRSEKARQSVMKRWNKKKDDAYDRNTNDILPNTQDPIPNNIRETIEQTFDEFWETWPSSKRKVDRAACLAKWKSKELYKITRLIVDHVIAMKEDQEWIDGFVPKPSTYLNQRRWEAGTGDSKVASINPLLQEDRSHS